VEAGQSTSVEVRLEREDCPGDVSLEVEGLPAGVELKPARIPAGETAAQLQFTAGSGAVASSPTVTLLARAGDARAEQEFRVTVQRPPGIPKEALTLDLGGGVKLELVYIKEGEFQMGSPEDEPERNPFTDQKEANAEKRHRVQITKPFWLGKYAVTQEQYTRLTGKDNPSYFAATGGGKGDVKGMDTNRFPVETVSWNDATAFCEELNQKHLSKVPEALRRAGYKFGLPTEAQWEYACRAGTETPFYFGKVLNGKQANCDGNYPYGTTEKGPYLGRTCRVGSYDANAFGLYDMHGNVNQWCADWYDPKFYSTSPNKDPFNGQKGAEERRVVRGGSWSGDGGDCRAACRGRGDPADRDQYCGFRVAFRLD
jgi:formylglycine-generating enzyme required for sulfatase activity